MILESNSIKRSVNDVMMQSHPSAFIQSLTLY